MFFHILMGSIQAAMVWSCLAAAGYVVFLHRNLILASIPVIKQRTGKIVGMDEMTTQAYADYFKWITIWTPFFVVATLNAAWMWWLLANDLEISTLHVVLSALAQGGVLTAVFANKLMKAWAYSWGVQIAYAQDDVVLEVLSARMDEINLLVSNVVKGSVTMSIEEMQAAMTETAAITYVSDQVTKRQLQQLAVLKKMSATQGPTQQ
jgi:hypothetical protein